MASGLEVLTGALAALGPAGTGLALAAVPVVAGAAIYITRMGSQARIDGLESQLDRLKTKSAEDLATAEDRFAELDAKYQGLLKGSALIQAQLSAIASETSEIADRVGAADYSVLVPAPTLIPDDAPDELVFLCASGKQAARLRWVRVQIASSLSGAAYRSDTTTIASPAASGASFAARTDSITDYKTKETLSVPLRYKGKRVGVAQFVNKRSGKFESADADRAQALCATLSVRVGDFVSDPRNLIELGHSPRRNQHKATIMMMDLSNYAQLFEAVDVSVVSDMLNQYFQDLCTIAMRRGATVDQFMGDGALLIFNLDQTLESHETDALKAATEMRRAFGELRQRWATLGYAGAAELRLRFGLASGLVTRAEIGHLQSRRMTVLGAAVNIAAHICDHAPRDRDTICIASDMRDGLASVTDWRITALPGSRPQAFEVA